MVYYFTSNTVTPSAYIYVGKDKVERNKKDNVTIIYTPWSNLKKDGSMATGQVSFHDNKKVKKILVPTRINAIINRLNKTKVEKFPDFAAERDEILKAKSKKNQASVQARKKEEARIAKERRELKYQKEHAYDDVFTEEALEASSNQNRDEDYLSDFM
ncbi:hypothetical protein V491_09425 [Pseudogymnoascus sp. VKM F-3775]|nr:hypothetical protein V491_09425 [Pseudogymnoascus sp. VKM F-3775]